MAKTLRHAKTILISVFAGISISTLAAWGLSPY